MLADQVAFWLGWLSKGKSLQSEAWYAAQTLAGLDRTAVEHLKRKGIEGYSPCAERGRRVFPGYVFVHIEKDQAGEVNRTRGVLHLLPVRCEWPLPLPISFVETLRAGVERGDFTEEAQAELLARFLPDQRLLALNGPMRDQVGRFKRYSKGCGVLLGCLLGTEFEYRVPLHQLRPAEEVLVPKSRSAMAA